MFDSGDTIRDVDECGVCSSPLRGRRYVHVEIESAAYLPLCSRECARHVLRAVRRERWGVRWRDAKRLAVVAIFVGGALAPHEGPLHSRLIRHALASTAAAAVSAAPAAPAALPEGWFGPDWPPNDTEALVALGRDAWIHPMPGPIRRMPRADSRVFGAERPGQRPAECRNGHCGVDLGGEIWGEHVHAVHDGVVDWVKRGVNPDHGGQFVRISHRDGTVFSLYFHLAAIPRWVERGVKIKSGDLIGLLGDTGVKESAPHLHFAMTIRPSKEIPERYIDPEPLVALWPLRIPIEGGEKKANVSTVALAGLPIGSALLSANHARRVRDARAAAVGIARRGAGESGGETPSTSGGSDDESGGGASAPAAEAPAAEGGGAAESSAEE